MVCGVRVCGVWCVGCVVRGVCVCVCRCGCVDVGVGVAVGFFFFADYSWVFFWICLFLVFLVFLFCVIKFHFLKPKNEKPITRNCSNDGSNILILKRRNNKQS